MSGRRFVAVVLAVIVGAAPFAVPVASAQDELPGAAYTPLSVPTRILDTRTDVGGHREPLHANETVNVAVPGLPADATAVVINLTGTGGTAGTYLSAFPNQFVGTSTLNLDAGQTAAVAAFVALGPKQTINILNRTGSVDVVADLVGYFATGADTGAGFASSPSPTRILDTRTAVGGHQRVLGPGEQLTLRVRGAGGVPADATAAVVNVTGVAPTVDTYLAVTPDGRGGTSTLNVARGAVRANLAVARIGSDGSVRIQNAFGSTHVVVDVQGWFAPGAGGRYMSLPVPRRVVDTRGDGGALAAGATRALSFAGTGVPAGGRTAVLFSLTGVRPTTDTYLTAWPQGRTRPLASNVNLRADETVSNAAISDTAAINLFNLSGSTHAVVDAAGYFYTPTTATPTVPAAPAAARVANAGDRTAVTWSAPDDGGLPITGYTLTVRPGGLRVTVDGHRTAVELAGLNPAVAYRISVAATNFAGTGQESTLSEAVSPSTLSRVDTDTAGAPDQGDTAWFDGFSDSGRYLTMRARSNSPLVPPPHRTATDTGTYLVRKDTQTEETVLVGVRPGGGALSVTGPSAISQDGTVAAYSGGTPSVLHVRDLTAGTVTEIATAPSGAAPADVALSTDGLWLSWTITDQRSTAVYRHDLSTGESAEVLNCPNAGSGCYLMDVLGASDDGGTLLVKHRASPRDPVRLGLLDAGSGTVRPLPDGTSDTTAALSGDGRWVAYAVGSGCPSCPDGRFELKRVATDPGATPETLREWTDADLWAVAVTDVSADGSVVGYVRQTGESGQWYAAAPAYVYDGNRGEELRIPQARSTAYLGQPVLSADGAVALLREFCFFGQACAPTGEYLLSVRELTP